MPNMAWDRVSFNTSLFFSPGMPQSTMGNKLILSTLLGNFIASATLRDMCLQDGR